jgi:hypothetical protein
MSPLPADARLELRGPREPFLRVNTFRMSARSDNVVTAAATRPRD